MTISFERTIDRLHQFLDEGLFTRGAQLAVEIDGERLIDIAMGDSGIGTAMTAGHIFRVYCTIKPITTIAIAHLVDTGLLDLDAPLRPLLPDLEVLGDDVTLAHVLTHTAGVQRPQAVEIEMLPIPMRRRAVAQARRPPGWRVGVDAAYSEYAGWQVLGWLIEAVTDQPLREHLRARVLDPLGLEATWIGMTDVQYRAVLPLLGVNADMRNLGGFPMLFERTPRVCQETNGAHGGYTNARDLARFYSAILDGLARDHEVLRARRR